MLEDPQTQLRRATGEFARTASLPPPHNIRARGDKRRRRRALGSGLLAVALLAGGGTAAFAVVRQPAAPPALVRPTGAPTPTPAPSRSSAPTPAASPSVTPAAMLPAGQVGPRSAVPWAQVGPGWELAEYSKAQPGSTGLPTKPTVLYLIDPEGGRYEMYRWPAGVPEQILLDWSGDRARALFTSPAGPPEVEQLTLATGVMTGFHLSQHGSFLPPSPGYTRPDGTNLLGISQSTRSRLQAVQRFSLTGTLAATLVTGSFLGNPVDSPDGAVVAVGAFGGVEVVSNAGGGARLLRVPGVSVSAGCTAARWWNSGTVLAACQPQGATGRGLWLVPADGATPTALTQPPPSGSAIVNYSNAWQLPSGLYLQAGSGSGCAPTWIDSQSAGGSVTRLNIPGAPTAVLLAVDGDRMLVATPGACGGDKTLLWFDPATGATQTVLSTPQGEVGATIVVPFGA